MTPVPVNDPVNEPVNGSVKLLNCVDDEIVPAAAPPADATYEAVSANDADAIDPVKPPVAVIPAVAVKLPVILDDCSCAIIYTTSIVSV
jgi:hypothetical protein